MNLFDNRGTNYLDAIKKRKKDNRVSQEFQLIGLEVADILSDHEHKSLYIKLTKEIGKDKILSLAKTVAETKNVENMGAYFMKVLYDPKEFKK
jgi:hypothetical protein